MSYTNTYYPIYNPAPSQERVDFLSSVWYAAKEWANTWKVGDKFHGSAVEAMKRWPNDKEAQEEFVVSAQHALDRMILEFDNFTITAVHVQA